MPPTTIACGGSSPPTWWRAAACRRSAWASSPTACWSRAHSIAGRSNEKVDGDEAAFLRQVHEVLIKVEAQWQQLTGQVSHVDAPGDSFAHLLNILGLQATSVDYQRRIGTYQAFLWNLAHLMIGGNFGGNNPMVRYFQRHHVARHPAA